DDVLWSLNRINDAHHPAHAAARNGFPYWAGMSMPGLIQSIARLDDYTVRITLTHPEAPFLADLAMSALASVYSAEYGEQLTRAGRLEELNTQPIGSGPYAFKSYQKDAVIRYVAHNAYWGGKPALDQLVFAITPDPSVRAQRLKAGECAVANVIGEQAESLASDSRIAVVPNPQLTTSYVAPNAKRRFLSDKRFRLALSLAIDRASLVKSVYGGYATVATSFVPPGIWSHDASLANPQDIEKAKALVKASGYDGSELTLFSVARRSDNKRAVELLQADWARIGVKVRPQLMELGELYKRTGKGEHDLAFLSWFSDNGDPDNFLSPNLACAAVEGGGNKAQWCNKTLDALLARARATTDMKQRTQLYLQAQKLLHDETGLIPIANKQGLSAVRKDVKGYQATLFGGNDFRAARIGD
ncbi:MAG TPA: ABC transporter substrate-binding protein, partial [Methylibium sp.]